MKKILFGVLMMVTLIISVSAITINDDFNRADNQNPNTGSNGEFVYYETPLDYGGFSYTLEDNVMISSNKLYLTNPNYAGVGVSTVAHFSDNASEWVNVSFTSLAQGGTRWYYWMYFGQNLETNPLLDNNMWWPGLTAHSWFGIFGPNLDYSSTTYNFACSGVDQRLYLNDLGQTNTFNVFLNMTSQTAIVTVNGVVAYQDCLSNY